MALNIPIGELVNGDIVESQRIDYKEGWNPEIIIHSICAFANDFHNVGVGYVVIGIEEENGLPILPPKGLDANQLDKYKKKL